MRKITPEKREMAVSAAIHVLVRLSGFQLLDLSLERPELLGVHLRRNPVHHGLVVLRKRDTDGIVNTWVVEYCNLQILGTGIHPLGLDGYIPHFGDGWTQYCYFS